MGMRLVAGLLVLALAACGEAPAPKPAPPPAVKSPPAQPPPGYAPSKSPTLETVRRRGALICGVHPGLPGFSYKDLKGGWRGFDVDICRALAAAVLGDSAKVRFVSVATPERFEALRDGRIDVLARNASWTLARDAGLGLTFPAVTYFDGQGFLVSRALNIASAEELSGATICVLSGTASEANLADYFRARGLAHKVVLTPSETEAWRLYQEDDCQAYTADISALAAARSVMNSPGAHVILPNVISKEPLGPVTRQDDPAFADVVGWTVHALVAAEEHKLSSSTVEAARASATDPEVRRLLGLDGDLGALLGLKPDWAFQAIRQVGAYDEIFRRNLGAGSPLRLERGLNALWNADPPGLLYAPPVR